MFDFLKKIFIKNRSKKIEYKAYVSFAIDTDDNIHISLNYRIDENNIGAKLGKLLYSINKGFLMKQTIDQLNKSISKDSDAKTIADILESWNNCYLIDGFNDPIIKPIGAFAKNVR